MFRVIYYQFKAKSFQWVADRIHGLIVKRWARSRGPTTIIVFEAPK